MGKDWIPAYAGMTGNGARQERFPLALEWRAMAQGKSDSSLRWNDEHE